MSFSNNSSFTSKNGSPVIQNELTMFKTDEHFTIVKSKSDNEPDRRKCNYCLKTYATSTTSSNLLKHLKEHDMIFLQNQNN